ncbi:hypothetical protein [Crenobacter intestini]|uniref:Uncharacterized protein n=1 Tax=Crenobacter intestini TaxID=2563443 RepID=A0A4T0UK71_9NEIS|nr:hypothetical protein [Crenobacter intestini]TIC78948.1 hypothetical protein E5K04_14410 [Crenobacter intestini]
MPTRRLLGWMVAIHTPNPRGPAAALLMQGAAYLSASTRICGCEKGAFLSNELLAHRFAKAMAPIMQKRHGAATELEVVRVERYDRASHDDLPVSQRLKA